MSKLKEMLKYIVPFILGVLVFALITDFEKTWAFISSIFNFIMYILSRFILGFGIAYILNFMVRFLKKRLHFPFWLSIVSSYIIFLGVLAGLVVYLVPYIGETIGYLVKNLDSMELEVRVFFEKNLEGMSSDISNTLISFFSGAAKQLANYGANLMDVGTIGPAILSAGRTLIDISFGVMISVYALIEKDNLLRSGRRIICALSKGDKGEKRLRFLSEANTIFSQFIVGKFIDSLVIAAISAVLYTIFGLELIPFIVFVTFLFNMLPYFGPIIGSAIIVLIMFFFSPLHALYALIICVAVQTADGFFIGPKILGSAVGISPLLTIIAISLGGDLFGFLGIFLGVPTLATFKVLVLDKWINEKLALKNIKLEDDWTTGSDPPTFKEKKPFRLPGKKKK